MAFSVSGDSISRAKAVPLGLSWRASLAGDGRTNEKKSNRRIIESLKPGEDILSMRAGIRVACLGARRAAALA
jgi:hypothetical protein